MIAKQYTGTLALNSVMASPFVAKSAEVQQVSVSPTPPIRRPAFLVDCRDDCEEGVSVALSVPSGSARYRAREWEMRSPSFVLAQAVAAEFSYSNSSSHLF
jgi:hypothetical protein